MIRRGTATIGGLSPHSPGARPAQPLLAVVIPVYKHSVLLGEAVTSALSQETDFELLIVIVNDGCPMVELIRHAWISSRARRTESATSVA